MTVETDEDFFSRADAFIDLANEQADSMARDSVSASFMFASARFNAWISATACSSAEAMRHTKQQRIGYFVEQYRSMLEENMESYVKNFDDYMRPDD